MIKKIWTAIAAIFLIISCKNQEKPEQDNNKHTTHPMPMESSSYCDSVNSGLIAKDTLNGSPARTAMATVNGTHVHIEYSSPGVKDRLIWGGLVAYDRVWVTGAHNATSIQFSKPVSIGGKEIPAGVYAFFTIPGKERWTAIINSRFDQHLADEYDEKEDLVRISVEPEHSPFTPRLTYKVEPGATGEEGLIRMSWNDLSIAVPFKTITP